MPLIMRLTTSDIRNRNVFQLKPSPRNSATYLKNVLQKSDKKSSWKCSRPFWLTTFQRVNLDIISPVLETGHFERISSGTSTTALFRMQSKDDYRCTKWIITRRNRSSLGFNFELVLSANLASWAFFTILEKKNIYCRKQAGIMSNE